MIAEAQRLAAETWEAQKRSSSTVRHAANEAMVLSSVVMAKIIVRRNVHKSVLMGLILCGATPVYADARSTAQNGRCGARSPEKPSKKAVKTPDAKAVLLVSLTYYGLCSDLQAIAELSLPQRSASCR